MTSIDNELINDPNPERLAEGLRDTGYDVKTALADVIDNSIAAGADEVRVDVVLNRDGTKLVYVSDNGIGMGRNELINAMKYGSDRRDEQASLGKFGLGLKTASSAICRNLSVISKKTNDEALSKLSWDLDHIATVNQWEMLEPLVTDEEREKFEDSCGANGTLVIWSKCDKLLNKIFEDAGGPQEARAIKTLVSRVEEHVAMIFCRFLDHADDRASNVTIFLNSKKVEAWDHFYKTAAEPVLLSQQQTIQIQNPSGIEAEAKIQAWILPRKESLSNEQKKIAKVTPLRQGFYIFRENRLIQSGGWAGIWNDTETHHSMLRVEFDFFHDLDEAFQVDIKKSSTRFDPAIEDYLLNLLTPARRAADQRSRQGTKKDIAKRGIDHQPSNRSLENTVNISQPKSSGFDETTGRTVVDNAKGKALQLKTRIEQAAEPANCRVEAVDTITTGDLWEPIFLGANDDGYSVGVQINKNHEFYQKIYHRAASSGYSVQGIDLLLWSLAAAEQNHTSEELEEIFEDLRSEVSTNLRKFLRSVDLPDETDLGA